MLLNNLTEFIITKGEVDDYPLQVEHFKMVPFFYIKIKITVVLKQYNMENTNAVAISADKNHQICSEMHSSKNKINAPYGKAVGSK